MGETVRKTEIYKAPECPCGRYLLPELINVTGFDGHQKWCLTWKCEYELQHDWIAANGAQ